VPLLLILGRPEVECTSLAPEPRLRPEMIRLPESEKARPGEIDLRMALDAARSQFLTGRSWRLAYVDAGSDP